MSFSDILKTVGSAASTISPAVGMVTSMLGGIGSFFSGQSSQKKMLEAQQKENQLNRDFNAQQAQLARDYNTQMVNAQNRYNSPVETMKRLQAAGLNPNLVYGSLGDMGSIGVGSTSSSASSSGSISPVMPDTSGLTSAGNSPLVAAQVRLLDAQAKKTDAERDLTAEELKWMPQINKGIIQLNDSNIRLTNMRTDLTEAEKKRVAKDMEQIQANTDLLKQNIQNARTENHLTQQQIYSYMIDNYIKSKSAQSIIDNYANEAKISKAEATYRAQQLIAAIAVDNSVVGVNVADVKLKHWQRITESWRSKREKQGYVNDVKTGDTITLNNGILDINMGILEATGEAQAWANFANSIISGIAEGVSMISPLKAAFGGKSRAVGFGR
ncbi:DNA pilot protein [Peromfec virus RodF7_9]|uniref:DNA pilot protein n=1 Tax=Peromfec virus RodF7_9 TaxID=2929356 RepID=A0A976N2C8_9VIRU|nr:DNA pilot protein [Peromfec virus RodF7_9]